jgi:hypothetical protein
MGVYGKINRTRKFKVNQEEELELLDITQQMLTVLESPDLVMPKEDKDSLESMNNSMAFFIEQGDFGRALKEGREFLKILDQI